MSRRFAGSAGEALEIQGNFAQQAQHEIQAAGALDSQIPIIISDI
jgi:hypothetical protein